MSNPTKAKTPQSGLSVGDTVRLPDGRTGKIIGPAPGSKPAGWFVRGVLGPVAAEALTIVRDVAPTAGEASQS